MNLNKPTKELTKIVESYNISNDSFFYYVAKDKDAMKEIIETVLGIEGITIVSSEPQVELRSVEARGVRLDALCMDSTGKYFNVEMQNADNDDMQKRVRFYIGAIDRITDIKHYSELPTVYTIMLCNFDIFKKEKPLYNIKRLVTYRPEDLQGDLIFADNGVHEFYVNLKADDGSAIAKLSEYILHSSGYNKDFPMLSGCVQSLKGNKEVKEAMVNEAWEELKDRYVKLAREEGRNEGREEGRSEGMELGRAAGRSEGMEIGKLAGIELGRAAGRSEGIDNVLEVMGISRESYLSSKREYDLKHNLA